MKTLLILLALVSLSFSQSFTTVKIDAKKDTVIKKVKLEKKEAKIDTLKEQVRFYKKLAKRYYKEKAMEEEFNRKLRIKGKKKIYYIVCEKDTAILRKKYDIKIKNWNNHRASTDSLCRVLETWTKHVAKYKKAYKDGYIKQYGLYGESMKRIYKYLNDPKNNFIEKEIKNAKKTIK